MSDCGVSLGCCHNYISRNFIVPWIRTRRNAVKSRGEIDYNYDWLSWELDGALEVGGIRTYAAYVQSTDSDSYFVHASWVPWGVERNRKERRTRESKTERVKEGGKRGGRREEGKTESNRGRTVYSG